MGRRRKWIRRRKKRGRREGRGGRGEGRRSNSSRGRGTLLEQWAKFEEGM